MKKIFKVILPSVFFLAFGISVMVMVLGCKKEPGSKCSSCSSNSDCDSGLQCYTFSDGNNRCQAYQGALCSRI